MWKILVPFYSLTMRETQFPIAISFISLHSHLRSFPLSLLSWGLLRSVDRTTLGRFRSSRDRKTCLIYRNCRQSRILKAPARNCGAGFRFGETPRGSSRASEKLPRGETTISFRVGNFGAARRLPTLYLHGVGDLSVPPRQRDYTTVLELNAKVNFTRNNTGLRYVIQKWSSSLIFHPRAGVS